MKWHSAVAAASLMVILTGCDKIPFIGGGSSSDSTATAVPEADSAAAAAPAADSTPTAVPSPPSTLAPDAEPETPDVEAPAAPAPEPPRQAPMPVSNEGEVPWAPTRGGTVNPGMSYEEVVGQWGDPVTERSLGQWTYLYYRNGCERACGTYDVVLLQGGQVVDAVVRAPNHAYSGVSSSPPNRDAMFTPPDNPTPDTLGVIG